MKDKNIKDFLRSIPKLILFIGIVVICFLIVVILYYKDYIQPITGDPYVMTEGKYIDVEQSRGSTYYSTQHRIEIKHAETLEQEFLSTEDIITGFRIQFVSDSLKEKDGEILFQVKDQETDSTVFRTVFSISELYEDNDAVLNVSANITETMNKRYIIVITPSLQDYSSTIELQRNLYDSVYGKMTYMGVEQEGDIIFSVYSGDLSDIKNVYFIFMLAFLLGMIFLITYIWKNHQNTAKCIGAFVFIIGLMYSMVLPSSTLPDENRHIRWAYAYSSWIVGDTGFTEDDTILMRESDLWLIAENRYPDMNTYVREYRGLFRTYTSTELIDTEVGSKSDCIGVAYLPQALGMAIARLLNWGTIPMLMLGRIIGLTVYTWFLYMAVKLMPFGKMVLGIISILPMTIWLGTGYSYDMLSIGSAYLFIAYVLRLAYKKDVTVGTKDWVKLSILLAILSSIKVVYIGIGFIAILIPLKKQKRDWKKYIGVLCTWISGLSAAFLVKLYLILRVLKLDQTTETLQKYYPSYFLEHPFSFFRIIVNTFVRGSEYLKEMIGQMGWLNINIPSIALIGFGIILFVSICYYGKEVDKNIKNLGEKIIIGLAALITIILFMVAMLFAETQIGVSYIKGLQGRYFLPAIPLILILLKNNIYISYKSMDRRILQSAVILHMVVIFGVFAQFFAT